MNDTVEARAEGRWLTRFSVPKMDCPSEERLIRLALDGHPDVLSMTCHLDRREVHIGHHGPVSDVAARLETLALGAHPVETLWQRGADIDAAAGAPAAERPSAHDPSVKRSSVHDAAGERRVLAWVLGINVAMFVIEGVAGLLAQSSGLMADALDMLADAAVYGMALWAVGRGALAQGRIARLSGVLQAALAVGLLLDVVRRLVFGSAPEAPLMVGAAMLALVANIACLGLLARYRDGGAHLRASWIFSTSDSLANLGIVVAAGLVVWTGSNLPDLAVGALIGVLVLEGARRILRLRSDAPG
ncbi:MAG: cation transporter [Gammaproteobacteria bacterium]